MTALDTADLTDRELEAMSTQERAAIGIPSCCPSWCTAHHREAIAEGCEPEYARLHIAADVAGRSHPVGDEKTVSWGMHLRSDPGPEGWHTGQPYIEVDLWHRGERQSDFRGIIDTGTARIIAAQLLHFADLGDLHSS